MPKASLSPIISTPRLRTCFRGALGLDPPPSLSSSTHRQGSATSGPTLLDGDEDVAGAAQLLLQAGAPAARAEAALRQPAGGGALAALAGAAVPDHLDVLGIGEGLAEVAIEV